MTKMLIKDQLGKFNDLIDSLIKGFTKYNLDEHTLIFLAKKTKRFMSFTHMAILNILFRILGTFIGAKDLFDKYIMDTNEIMDNIFKQMENSLNDILTQKVGINDQEEIDGIVLNLKFMKKIITNLGEMAISVLKFQSNTINEDEFREEYRKFKDKFDKDKQTFEDDIKKDIS
jgi:hypothetical protein